MICTPILKEVTQTRKIKMKKTKEKLYKVSLTHKNGKFFEYLILQTSWEYALIEAQERLYDYHNLISSDLVKVEVSLARNHNEQGEKHA